MFRVLTSGHNKGKGVDCVEYTIAKITDEDIKIISNAETQIKSQTGNEVILIAYQPQKNNK